MKRVGSDVTAEDRWRAVGASYAKGMAAPYHDHRIAVIKALTVPKDERWKLMFQCSMFGVRAIWLLT